MVAHFLNLLSRSWASLMSALGTTTLGVLIFSLMIPGLTLCVVTIAGIERPWSWTKLKMALKEGIKPTLISSAVTIAVLRMFLSAAMVTKIYDDHQSLVPANTAKLDVIKGLRTDKATVTPERDALKDENAKLKNTPAKIVTNTELAPDEPRKCWIFVDRGVNPNKDFDYARKIIVYCNKRTEPPARIAIEFDNEFAEGEVDVLGARPLMTAGNPNRRK